MLNQAIHELFTATAGDYDDSRLLDIHSSSYHPEMNALYEEIMPYIVFKGPKAKAKTIAAMKGYLRLILSNMVIGAYHGKYTVICRKAEAFIPGTRYGKLRIRRIPFLRVIDSLVDAGWLKIVLGHPSKFNDFNDQHGKKAKGQLTRIRASEKLIERLKPVTMNDITTTDNRLIVLKDSTGVEIDYAATDVPPDIESRLALCNEAYAEHYVDFLPVLRTYVLNSHNNTVRQHLNQRSALQIRTLLNTNFHHLHNKYVYTPITASDISNPDLISPYGNQIEVEQNDGQRNRLFPRLQAVFNRGSFKCGGRLFCKASQGEDYQQLSQASRKTIRIDGVPTVEYDYKSLHISMLYNLERQILTGDPYVGLDRPIAKRLLLTAINGADEKSVMGSIRYEISKLMKKPFLKERDRKFLDAVEAREIDWHKEIVKLKTVHQPIAHWFCSDAGIKLMTLDSIIIMDVILHFAEKGIPALPIHDSVIVAEPCGQELKQVMEDSYRRHMNGYYCQAEKK